ncbi:NRAMP family divalent metal transporter [Curtobacterium ammoniigenes]|uniref:NRAMP family divalent metal transporter n=1 Tax=Curtobacterium ammoniigenes TaxID=395387 RepID=UPI000837A8D7|nr:divalent metal cation transporter [Curtobacterium ammoniigenes]
MTVQRAEQWRGRATPRQRSKGIAALALGVLAGIGGFLDTGGVITAVGAGARFQYALTWTVVFGLIGFAVFAEISGRVAVASGQPTYEVIRTRLGPRLGAIPLIANVIVHVLVLAVDLVGIALALQLLTGVGYLVWVPVGAIGLALALWIFNFSRVDTAAALAGLTMLVMVAAIVALGPRWGDIGLSLVHPTVGGHYSSADYFFGVASLIGSFMTPYQFDFYSAGAVEEGWTGEDLKRNRVVAVVGTTFGAVLTLAVMDAGGKALYPYRHSVDSIRAAGQPATSAFGHVGFIIFVIGVLAVSVAACVELCLSGGYGVAQYFGWDWGKSGPAREAPMFNIVFLGMIVVAAIIDLTGVNPMQFTVITMALSAAALPFSFIPLLLVANDPQFMGRLRNPRPVNIVAGVVLGVLVLITLATFPLLVITGGNF